MALWPISSTTIMAVSWSSGWLMVTIWPSFIRCLMTSEALTAILCASSATVMVSGTCTSITRASAGAACTCCLASRSLTALAPGAATPAAAAHAAAGVAAGRDGLLLGRIAGPAAGQLGRFDFLARAAPAAGGAPWSPGLAGLAAVVPAAGLCSVPLHGRPSALPSWAAAAPSWPVRPSSERMAAASASALRRRASRSARAVSSSARALALRRSGLGFGSGGLGRAVVHHGLLRQPAAPWLRLRPGRRLRALRASCSSR